MKLPDFLFRHRSAEFRAGAEDGFRVFLPASVGLIPWGLVTGMAMVSAGFSPLQAMGMNVLVFAGAAQLGTLPLIVSGAPLWLIVAVALAINLRFVIFSAAVARGLSDHSLRTRWLCGHLLTDGAFAVTLDKMLTVKNRDWRLGHYLAPALWSWVLWQCCTMVGIAFAGSIPKSWSLEFMATLALLVLLIPMAKARPMLVSALVGAATAVALHALPLRLGLFFGIFAGILAGFAAEHWQTKKANE